MSKLIGIDGSEAFTKNRTGVENYAYEIIKHLSLIDKKNRYIIYLDPRVNTVEGEWPKNFQFKKLNYKIAWTQIGLGLQTFKDHLDLLFIPSHTLPVIKRSSLKSIVTVHDLGAEYLPSLHQLKQRLYLSFMTNHQLKNATKIIAVSNATKKDIIKKVGIKSERINIVYEGFNTNLKRQTFDTERYVLKHLDIEKKRFFLFVGTVQPRKNLINLIKAYNQFSKNKIYIPKLVIAGAKGWLSDEIYALPTKLGIEEKVKFLGRVDNRTLSALYSSALALTYPSLFEGFGLPILEAFNFKLPVITSNTSSMPEVAGDAAVLVNPNSVEDIARALENIEKNKKLRDILVEKGKLQVKKFSWRKAAQETLAIFEKVAGEEKVQILGTKVSNITLDESLEKIDSWVKKGGKYYLVTPNIEFVMAALKDPEFNHILNKADLAIPDSGRFNWALDIQEETNPLFKLIKWPLYFYPRSKLLKQFPVVTGTDLMENLLVQAGKEGYRIGLFGGSKAVAERLEERLKREFPKLNVRYINYDVRVDKNGNTKTPLDLPPLDILFVAFGQIKQEKWIANNLTKQNVKVMIGVGGAFDYLSGMVSRAPKAWRDFGFEWLYRLIVQPWRIRRFWALVKFIFLMPFFKQK